MCYRKWFQIIWQLGVVSFGIADSGRIQLILSQVFCYVRMNTTIFVAFLVFHCKNKTTVNAAKILDCLSVKKLLEQVVLREFFSVSRSL